MIDFKLLSIGDLNPYGGWNSLKEFVTDSSYEFEGIIRSMALTIALLVAAIVGGGFFCGWICPVETMQDLSFSAMTMLLFFVVWLGMPKLWVGRAIVNGIALNNLKD